MVERSRPNPIAETREKFTIVLRTMPSNAPALREAFTDYETAVEAGLDTRTGLTQLRELAKGIVMSLKLRGETSSVKYFSGMQAWYDKRLQELGGSTKPESSESQKAS